MLLSNEWSLLHFMFMINTQLIIDVEIYDPSPWAKWEIEQIHSTQPSVDKLDLVN